MKAIECDCPPNMVDKWWLPLKAEGFEVMLFHTDERAISIAKEVVGELMWSDSIVKDDVGGLVIVDGVTIFVSVRQGPAGPANQQIVFDTPQLYYAPLKQKRPFLSLSREELEAQKKLGSVFARHGISSTPPASLFRRWFGNGITRPYSTRSIA